MKPPAAPRVLNLRVYGTEGGLEWRQEEPNYLIFKPSKAPAEVLKRGNEYLCEAAKKVSRLPPGLTPRPS